MKSALSFLIASRRCEIDELEQLGRTSELVGAIGRLVHGLQRERGLSNVLLASSGKRFAAQRHAQITECMRLEHDVRVAFEALEMLPRRPVNGTRLFSRIASVMPGLDALPLLRRRITALELHADQATGAYAKLVAGLIAVVFEAADGATDPEISRVLASLFNLMQGKEYAGQERACGAASFTAGENDEPRRRQWLQLIAAQERCFQFFADFGGPTITEAWRAAQPSSEMAALERMRRIACASSGTVLDTGLATIWFDTCSLRIDALKGVEERLANDLQALCVTKIAAARAEADAHEAMLASLPPGAEMMAQNTYFDAGEGGATLGSPAGPFGHLLERSILDMLQEQSRRVQSMSDELEAVRGALNERKLVERAKGLLMARRRLSEQDAHKLLRQTAMKQNRRLVDVAESVLAMADVLPDGP